MESELAAVGVASEAAHLWRRRLPWIGVLVAFACYGVATSLYPGGYDWNRNYISSLLRGPSGAARLPALMGLMFYCVSIAFVFDRLARAAPSAFALHAIRIGGIGSMVYSALAFTPLHDLVVMISIAFFTVAIVALLHVLVVKRSTGHLVMGSVCFAIFLASVAIYYSDRFVVVLPWAQRILFALFAAWLVLLDMSANRLGDAPGLR